MAEEGGGARKRPLSGQWSVGAWRLVSVDPAGAARRRRPKSVPRRILRASYNYICGFSDEQQPDADAQPAALTSLEEDPFMKRVLDVNAAFAIMVMLYLWGLFA